MVMTLVRIFYNGVFILVVLFGFISSAYSQEDLDTPKKVATTATSRARLQNGKHIPLVGFGVGNLQHELIEKVMESNLGTDKNVRLIDTARASRNEHIIANAIAKLRTTSTNQNQLRGGGGNGVVFDDEDLDQDTIHIVTKVWYTHLGYERTRLSVLESLQDLSAATANNVVVHVLLHWPRCNDDIPWMNCEEEENNLPQYVKKAGPPPHLDKDNAWRESWRALEDMYTEHGSAGKLPKIGSIGVSNFELMDMKSLISTCRIKPSIYQGNLWLVLHDPYLMQLLQENEIIFQAYNLMNGAIHRKDVAPNAFKTLTTIGSDLSLRIAQREGLRHQYSEALITEAMVAMEWLIENGISVIPRASSANHQLENSVTSIEFIPELTEVESSRVRDALSALMRGEDLILQTTFHNALSSNHGPVEVHWKSGTGEEVKVIDKIHPGESNTINAHPGHTFVVYDEEKSSRREFVVSASYGEKESFSVDEF